MPQTAGKPSPTPTKAVASTEGEDKTKQRKQFKKTALRTNLFTVALPLGITGLLYGAMAMCCIMWPQSFLATSYIGYSTAWLVKINPFAITVIFNLSFLGLFAAWVYFKELAQEISDAEVAQGAKAEDSKPEPKKKK